MKNKNGVDRVSERQLQKIRKEKKLSQKVIYEGLCSQASYSKIEQGKKEADLFLFYGILSRLGIFTSKYTVILTKEEEEMAKQRKKIELCIQENSWEEGEERVLQYWKQDFSHVTAHLHEQYLCFMEAKIAYGRGEVEKAISKLKIGIEKTNKNLLEFLNGNSEGDQFRVSSIEMSQFCMFCELLSEQEEERRHRKRLLLWAKNYLEKKIEDTEYQIKYYPFVLYSIANMEREEQEYMKSLIYCEEGIAFLKRYKSLAYLKELLKLYQSLVKEIGMKGKEENKQYLSMLEYIENTLLSERIEGKRTHLGAYFVGDIIKNTREYVGKTQEQLNDIDEEGRGKADPSTLSKIENGHRSPRKITGEYYFQQLGLGEYQTKLPVVIGSLKAQELRWRIDHMVAERDFEKVKRYMEQLEKELDLSLLVNEQYINWVKVVIAYHSGKISLNQYREELIEILKITWNTFELKEEKKLIRLLSRKEITIYINIAQTYIMQKQYEQGIFLYQKLKDYFEEVYQMAGYSSYSLLCMSLEQALGLNGAYDESILQAKKGICMEYFYEDGQYFHKHLYNIGWNYGKKMEEAKEEREKEQYKKACQLYLEQALKGAVFMNNKNIIQLVEEKKKLWKLL